MFKFSFHMFQSLQAFSRVYLWRPFGLLPSRQGDGTGIPTFSLLVTRCCGVHVTTSSVLLVCPCLSHMYPYVKCLMILYTILTQAI